MESPNEISNFVIVENHRIVTFQIHENLPQMIFKVFCKFESLAINENDISYSVIQSSNSIKVIVSLNNEGIISTKFSQRIVFEFVRFKVF